MGHVRGYRRKDGTYVRPHYRQNPGPRGGSGIGVAIAVIILILLVAGMINHAT